MPPSLHICLIAVACNPFQGSEQGLAWKSILALAGRYRITVLTHTHNREDIEKFIKNGELNEEISNIRFIYIGRSMRHSRNQALARLLIWHHYRVWLDDCVELINNEKENKKFDIIHHVTFSTWRMGSPFYKTGIPTVWGPVGGAGKVPLSAFSMLSIHARLTESLRAIISKVYSQSPSFRKSLETNTVVLASNRETQGFLNQYSKRPVEIVFPCYFENGGKPETISHPPADGPLRCFYGGGIIGSKGISLSFAAIALARKRGVKIEFKIAGIGPETDHLKLASAAHGISDLVKFLPLLKGEDYVDILNESDIFLFPSFRENIGITMVDAMLHDTTPIVLDTSAPGEIVTMECGWKIPVSTPERISIGIADALVEAYGNREILKIKGRKARARILENYSIEKYVSGIEGAYRSALSTQTT